MKGFAGEKIKIDRILNTEIVVEAFKVVASKFDGKGDCLHLQIKLKGEQRVVFIGSKYLIDTIQQVPQNKFPFQTRIVKEDNCYQFT